MDYNEKRRQVENLLHGKFPFSWAPPPEMPVPASAAAAEVARFNRAEHDRLMAEIDAERRSLMKKTEAEVGAAHREYIDGLRKRGEQAAQSKELVRFFNLPSANADFAYWAKAEYWTLDESVALLFGKAPEQVNWPAVQPYVKVSEFAKQYERVRSLALRAQAMNRGQTAVCPRAVLDWANEVDIPVPTGLQDALALQWARKHCGPSVAVAQAAQPAEQDGQAASVMAPQVDNKASDFARAGAHARHAPTRDAKALVLEWWAERRGTMNKEKAADAITAERLVEQSRSTVRGWLRGA